MRSNKTGQIPAARKKKKKYSLNQNVKKREEQKKKGAIKSKVYVDIFEEMAEENIGEKKYRSFRGRDIE